MAGIALAIRKIGIAAMITSPIAPEPVVNQRNRLSAPNRRRVGRAPPPPRGEGGVTSSAGSSGAASAASDEPVSADWLIVSPSLCSGGWCLGSGHDAHGAGDLRTHRAGPRRVADPG